LTPRRLWATTAAVLALVGVVTGGLALARSAGRIGTGNGRTGGIVALVAGGGGGGGGGVGVWWCRSGGGARRRGEGGGGGQVWGRDVRLLGGLARAPTRRRVGQSYPRPSPPPPAE